MRYDGGDCMHHVDEKAKLQLQKWQKQGILLALCPEVAGGLPIPRPAAEIQGKRVKTSAGEDVTASFQAGARRAWVLCQQHDIQLAILKQGSPSCGNSQINDGSFCHHKIKGEGITAQFLRERGVLVLNEHQLGDMPAV